MTNTNILPLLIQGVWMMDERTMMAALPMFMNLAAGKDSDVSHEKIVVESRNIKPMAVSHRSGSDSGQMKLVAVHPVKGVIVKNSYYWSSRGTEQLLRRMVESDNDPEVVAHILEMDSGGGEATNIESIARAIRFGISKPVLTWYNGSSASAAYYLASGTDEIYASEETDQVGAIGSVASFLSYKEYWEKMGIKSHRVVSDLSPDKGQMVIKALEGDYKMLKEDLLNPYARRFIDTVREFRPNASEEVFTGKMYMTEKAIELGLIDGQRTFNETVDRAFELGNRQLANFNSNINMKKENIEAVLGAIEVQEGAVYLNEEQVEKLNAALVNNDNPAVTALADRIAKLETPAPAPAPEAKETKEEKQEDPFAKLNARLDDMAAKITKFGGTPGADASQVVKPEGDDTPEDLSPEAKDLNDKYNGAF